jgi:hypothetical protein
MLEAELQDVIAWRHAKLMTEFPGQGGGSIPAVLGQVLYGKRFRIMLLDVTHGGEESSITTSTGIWVSVYLAIPIQQPKNLQD